MSEIQSVIREFRVQQSNRRLTSITQVYYVGVSVHRYCIFERLALMKSRLPQFLRELIELRELARQRFLPAFRKPRLRSQFYKPQYMVEPLDLAANLGADCLSTSVYRSIRR